MIVTVALRDTVSPPAGAPWLTHGTLYYALVILVKDAEAMVHILGPDGECCELSSRDVRRIADDWPDH